MMRTGFRQLLAPTRSPACALAVVAAALALAVGTLGVDAQTPQPPAPGAPPKSAPPPKQTQPKQPKQAPPKQAPPAQAAPPAPPAAPPPAAAQQPQTQQVPLVYTPWIKICGKSPQDPNAKEICQTAKEARLENGQFMAAAAFIEQAGDAKKIVQVMLPPGLLIQPGTRLIVDKDPPLSGPFVICFVNACMAHYEVQPDFVTKMKRGQTLEIQAMSPNMQAVNFLLPLAEFAKANEGPPTDPKVLEEQQKKLQEQLQRKGEEQQKQLGGQGQPGTAAPAK